MPTVIFKPTEQCNARCTYCDVVANKAPKTMELDLLEDIFVKMNEFLLAYPEEDITLIWHGGEPLLLGVDYYRKAIDFQNRHCPDTKHRITHAIQSNLTAMREEYIEVFRALGIQSVGTSFEPIPGIRGIGKKVNSELYNRKFFDGITILEKNDIGWGFIYVVTKKSLADPLGVFHFLSNLKPDGGFMMNPVLVYGNDPDDNRITPMEYVRFIGEIFPVWWENRKRYPGVEPFAGLCRYFEQEGEHLGCVDSGKCAYNHVYIGPSGETSQCGRSEDWGLISYGNVRERSLIDILKDKDRELLLDRTEYLKHNDCAECRFWNVCHGGCPLDAWQEGDEGFMRKTYWCAVRKAFIENYFEPITGYRFERKRVENEACVG